MYFIVFILKFREEIQKHVLLIVRIYMYKHRFGNFLYTLRLIFSFKKVMIDFQRIANIHIEKLIFETNRLVAINTYEQCFSSWFRGVINFFYFYFFYNRRKKNKSNKYYAII